jgi:hypothetical protein
MRKRNVGILCTIWWLVWKEQNKHIFENSESSTQQAASSIEEKVKNNPFHLIAILTVTAVDVTWISCFLRSVVSLVFPSISSFLHLRSSSVRVGLRRSGSSIFRSRLLLS